MPLSGKQLVSQQKWFWGQYWFQSTTPQHSLGGKKKQIFVDVGCWRGPIHCWQILYKYTCSILSLPSLYPKISILSLHSALVALLLTSNRETKIYSLKRNRYIQQVRKRVVTITRRQSRPKLLEKWQRKCLYEQVWTGESKTPNQDPTSDDLQPRPSPSAATTIILVFTAPGTPSNCIHEHCQ